MIIQLIFLLAASCWAQHMNECKDNEACLYHYRCASPSPSGEEIVIPTFTTDISKWQDEKCDGGFSSTKLSVSPMTSRLWNISIHSSVRNVGIRFGDSLTILTNGTDASFKEDSDTPINFPLYQESAYRCTLEIKSKYPKLHDIFSLKSILYIEKTMKKGSTSSKQPKFWQKILELTPCDSTRIIDDCQDKATQNCTKLSRYTDSIKCQDNMWLKTNESSWMQLHNVQCDKGTKYWALSNVNKTLPLSDEIIEVQCAVEQPGSSSEHELNMNLIFTFFAAWETSIALQPSEKIIAEKRKKEKEAKDSLLDSPFVWVGIALVGLIAVAAVLLAIGYAYFKLWKNPTQKAKSTISKTVDYTQLSQDSSNQTGSNSGKETEKDTKKMYEPSTKQSMVPTPPPSLATQTPAAPPQEAAVSRLDGPNANTVNRLSMIKTITDSNVEPIPAPPSN